MELKLFTQNDREIDIAPFSIISDVVIHNLLNTAIPKYNKLGQMDNIYKIKVTQKSPLWNNTQAQDDVFLLSALLLTPTGELIAPASSSPLFLKKEVLANGMYRYTDPNKFALKSSSFSYLWTIPKISKDSAVRPYLYPHQMRALKVWKQLDNRCLWAHDMGLGKTFSAGFILYLNKFRNKFQQPLVLTLASILPKWEMILQQYNVPYVLLKTGMDVATIPKGIVALGNIEKIRRKKAPKKDGTPEGDLVASRFARLPFLERISILFRPDFFDLVCFDESHKLNQSQNLCVKVLGKIIAKKASVLFMSGTPFGNGFTEVFPQMNLIQPGLLGVHSTSSFHAAFCKNVSKSPNYPSWEVDEFHHPLLKKLIYSKADFVKNAPGIELPPFTESDVPYRFTSEQLKLDKMVTKNFILPLPANPPEWLTTMCPEGIPITSAPAVRHLKRMICSGTMNGRVYIPGMPSKYDKEGYPLTYEFPTRKLLVLTDILDGLTKTQQSLIWVNYTNTSRNLVKTLKNKGYSISMIYGGTPKKARGKILADFLSGKVQHLISHPKCLGTGLDFINATTQVAYECTESYIDYEQAKKRSHRISQTKAVNILRLYGQSSIERAILNLLSGKLEFSAYLFGIKAPPKNDKIRFTVGMECDV